MRVSFVLRLDPAALAVGRFSGEVEAVASGSWAALRAVDDLVAFCAGHVDDSGGHGAHAVITSLDPEADVQGPPGRGTGGDQKERQR